MPEMVQDQRKTYRHTLALDTEVHCHESSLQAMFRCRTENIGMGGAFLPASELLLEKAVDVELVFHIPATPAPKEYRIQAQVVRTSDAGAGLSFSPLDRERLQQFRRFLLEAKVAARH